MWSRIGELMYEKENLEATVAYCQSVNLFIKDIPKEDVMRQLLERVEKKYSEMTPDELRGGVMYQALNVFYVIDPYEQPGIEISLPMENGEKPAKYGINFFVRMGRELRSQH